MTQNKFIKIILGSIILFSPLFVFGQEASEKIANGNGGMTNLNIILLVVIIILLYPIFISGKAFVIVMKEYIRKSKPDSANSKKAGLLIFLFFLYQVTNAQSTSKGIDIFTTDFSSWVLTGFILVECLLIGFFSWLTLKFLNGSFVNASSAVPAEENARVGWLSRLWNKLNNFKPIEEEADIDTGHSYDGIRELDNIVPPWFNTAFVLTIIFGIVYMYRYHVSESVPLQAEEYRIEMEEAEKEKAEFLALQSNNIDENSIAIMGMGDIEAGKKLFSTNCVACHGAGGGSMPGGVGPNLTDNYWLHGGSLQDIFKTIKYGKVDKGMIAWKDQLSPKQLAQITNYIKAIGGSNPPGAKDPQGELYYDNTVKADSLPNDTSRIISKTN